MSGQEARSAASKLDIIREEPCGDASPHEAHVFSYGPMHYQCPGERGAATSPDEQGHVAPSGFSPGGCAAPAAAKGDGETWEDYAHRLEARIKEQRDHIKNLTELRKVPGDIKARKRIATLERLLGKKELALAQQHEGLHALKRRLSTWDDGSVDGAIDILAQIPYESGREIADLIEQRRGEIFDGRSSNG